MQMNMPRFHDAHLGFLDVLQSAQCLLHGSCNSCIKRALFFTVVACDLLWDISGGVLAESLQMEGRAAGRLVLLQPG